MSDDGWAVSGLGGVPATSALARLDAFWIVSALAYTLTNLPGDGCRCNHTRALISCGCRWCSPQSASPCRSLRYVRSGIRDLGSRIWDLVMCMDHHIRTFISCGCNYHLPPHAIVCLAYPMSSMHHLPAHVQHALRVKCRADAAQRERAARLHLIREHAHA